MEEDAPVSVFSLDDVYVHVIVISVYIAYRTMTVAFVIHLYAKYAVFLLDWLLLLFVFKEQHAIMQM